MDNLEEIINPESIEIIVIENTQDEWDNNFGDHSISSF